jgi:hypothetical protein
MMSGTDVIDDVRTGTDGRFGHGGLHGVDADGDRIVDRTDAFDDGNHTAQFFGGIDGIGAGSRALSADVQHVRTFADQSHRVVHCPLHRVEGAAVGKGIGRDVHHTHDLG